jgi:O-succinylbenzoic acid--CoA ligase
VLTEAIDILSAWRNGESAFTLTTSGSTGEPTPITHSREALTWSAMSTLHAWYNPTKPPFQLCALPLNKAGGFMQLIRAAVWQSSIWITTPTSNPLSNLDAAHLLQFNRETKQFETRPLSQDLWNQYKPTTVSLTPMQLSLILNEPSSASMLSDFEVVLIGGQALSAEIEQRLITDYPNTRFIHTFGSTETASHFAGREITPDNLEYLIAPGTQIKTNQLGELQIANPTTKQAWLTLHDRVTITAPNRFQWIERSNLYINTGGVKIAIETLESQIATLTHWPLFSFYIAGKSHPVYGEQITLFTTHNQPLPQIQAALSSLNKLEQPKEIVFIPAVPTLSNGKIYRNPNP